VSECLDVKNYKWRLNPVWHRMLYSCTHMTAVGIKGLRSMSMSVGDPSGAAECSVQVSSTERVWTASVWEDAGNRQAEPRCRNRQLICLFIGQTILFCGHPLGGLSKCRLSVCPSICLMPLTWQLKRCVESWLFCSAIRPLCCYSGWPRWVGQMGHMSFCYII